MSGAKFSLARPRNARIACRKCHSRKVKCSGGMPCTNCSQVNNSAECKYPRRTQRVKVELSYIDELLDEIHRLQQLTTHPGKPPAPGGIGTPSNAEPSSPLPSFAVSADSLEANALQVADGGSSKPATETEDTIRNPLLDDRPWFFPLTPEMPVLIGEATDVAFATRFRQELSGQSQSHYSRTQHVPDETISSLWNSNLDWPTPSMARFLLKVVFSTLCRRYYLVRKTSTLQLLEQALLDPMSCDMLATCKLFALFALGEVYSKRTCQSQDQFPGFGFYVSATRMLRVLSEQPRIDCVEIMVMLSLYSLTMNRRHSAYCLVGYAVRFGIIMGLHLNVPQNQLPNRELQEHRNRVWWTLYILDRSWAYMLGKPVSIQDEDIDVNLPSTLELSSESIVKDFADTDYLTASISVAELSAQITASLYTRRTHRSPFSCRVQQALRDLSAWLQDLPEPLRTDIEQVPPNAAMPIITLHLYFNQCLILASRPVLLHVFRLRQISSAETSNTGAQSISENALALSGACIQCARRSHRILTDSWINGSFPTFDFTYTQYLFSVSIILAISSLLHSPDSQNDSDDFEALARILNELDQNGNFAAKEYSKHVETTFRMLKRKDGDKKKLGHDDHPEIISVAHDSIPDPVEEWRPLAQMTTDSRSSNLPDVSLQNLLSQPSLDLEFLEQFDIADDFQNFVWPEEGGVVGRIS